MTDTRKFRIGETVLVCEEWPWAAGGRLKPLIVLEGLLIAQQGAWYTIQVAQKPGQSDRLIRVKKAALFRQAERSLFNDYEKVNREYHRVADEVSALYAKYIQPINEMQTTARRRVAETWKILEERRK